MSKLNQRMAKFWYDPADANGREPVLIFVEKAAMDDLKHLVLELLDGDAGDDLDGQCRIHAEDAVERLVERARERGRL